jgi:hypothetical protein
VHSVRLIYVIANETLKETAPEIETINREATWPLTSFGIPEVQEPSLSGQLGILAKGYPLPDKIPTTEADAGSQVQPRRHDAGSGANETTDGLDASTEALRHAAEDTPSGALPEDVEIVPVFDRADLAPKI